MNEKGWVQDSALACDMANAEKPHRDAIAERKEQIAEAQANGKLALHGFADGPHDTGGLPGYLDLVSSERANRYDLERAERAAEGVRRQHQA